ncbi:MAG: HEAT repeat domain-containing protein [Pirellulales bacterium]|nr:HEAT repeat domain-containing protein [Pirellulales bacterium]
MNADRVEWTVDDLARFDQLPVDERRAALQRVRWWRTAPNDDVVRLLTTLAARPALRSPLWTPLVENLVEGLQNAQPSLAPETAAGLADLVLVQPLGPVLVDRIFALLARRGAQAAFPRLLAGLTQPELAVAVLDLANELVRRGLANEHPAADRFDVLIVLLGATADRLDRVAESPAEYATDARALKRLVDDGVALASALCYALALIGRPQAEAALRKALALPHRRLQAEAAHALARIGQPDGVARLVELAADPAARTRVLHYLAELDETERVPAELRTPAARAVGELAAWLALPQRFGMAPQSLEVLDERTWFWPGYEQQQTCWLVRYEYRLPGVARSGVGIVGPLTAALDADLLDLSPEDIYAAYAGSDVEHAELVLEPAATARASLRATAARLEQSPALAEYSGLEPVCIGSCFGDVAAVFLARRSETQGTLLVADDAGGADHLQWYPHTGHARPIGPQLAWAIFVGRKLLRTFNPAQDS